MLDKMGDYFLVAAGAIFGYYLGGWGFALLGAVLGAAALYGMDWFLFVPDDSNTFVGPTQ